MKHGESTTSAATEHSRTQLPPIPTGTNHPHCSTPTRRKARARAADSLKESIKNGGSTTSAATGHIRTHFSNSRRDEPPPFQHPDSAQSQNSGGYNQPPGPPPFQHPESAQSRNHGGDNQTLNHSSNDQSFDNSIEDYGHVLRRRSRTSDFEKPKMNLAQHVLYNNRTNLPTNSPTIELYWDDEAMEHGRGS